MNPRILALAAGLAVGYVLGTRAGRQQYDRLVGAVRSVWDDPRVARARQDVEDYAREQAPLIRARAEAAAKAAPGAVADAAKEVAERVGSTSRDVADRAGAVAKDIADNAREAAERVQATAKDVTERVAQAAGDARDRALHVFEDDDSRDDEAPRT